MADKIVYTKETASDNIGTVVTFHAVNAPELTADVLYGLTEDSETVVRSVDEDKLKFSVDGETVAKIDRAILTPVSPPTADAVPVVGTDGAVSYVTASEFGGATLKVRAFGNISELLDFLTENEWRVYKITYGNSNLIIHIEGQYSLYIDRATNTVTGVEITNVSTDLANDGANQVISKVSLLNNTLTEKQGSIIFVPGNYPQIGLWQNSTYDQAGMYNNGIVFNVYYIGE